MAKKSIPFCDAERSSGRWEGQPRDKSRSHKDGYYQALFISLSIPPHPTPHKKLCSVTRLSTAT